MGRRIFERREELGIKRAELARSMGVATSEIWKWERGVYMPHWGRHAQLAAILQITVLELRHGPLPISSPTSDVGGENSASDLERIVREFYDAARRTFGSPLGFGSDVVRAASAHPSCLWKLLIASHRALQDIRILTSGCEFRAVEPLLDTIADIGELAIEFRAPEAEEVVFEANAQAVQGAIFSAPIATLKSDTAPHLSRMGSLALDRPHLRTRYWALAGDVLKIRAGMAGDPALNGRALDALKKGIEACNGKPSASDGYQAVRTLPIVAARCDGMSGSEFDAITGAAKDAMQSSDFTLHENAHILDGLSEAAALRFRMTADPRHQLEALNNMELAEREARRAGLNGEHAVFDMLKRRLPLILGQAGILSHLGETEAQAQERMWQLVLHVIDEARKAGIEWTVEEMVRILVDLSR